MKDDISYVVNILGSMRADQKDHLYSQFGEAYSDVSFIDVHFFATEFLYMFRLFLFLPSHFDSIGKLFPDGLWMSENISICTPLRLMRQLLTQTGYNSPYSQKANGKCWPFPAFSFQVCKKTFTLPYLDVLAVEETTVFSICMAKNAIFVNAALSRCLYYSVCISFSLSIFLPLPLPFSHFVCLSLSVSIQFSAYLPLLFHLNLFPHSTSAFISVLLRHFVSLPSYFPLLLLPFLAFALISHSQIS